MVKNIVIIGGGFAGVAVASGLEKQLDKSGDKDHRIILIEKKDHFYHCIAGPRAAVAEWDNRIIIPYTKLFKNKRNAVIQAAAVSLEQDAVGIDQSVADFGDSIPYDYLVIATGTKYPSPAKSATNDSAGTRAHLEDIRSKVKAANSIVIVGGGPVGVEFAGEIREVYANKKVTIVHDTAQVFDNSGNKKFSNKAHDLLVKNKIDLIYNDVGIIPADVKDPFFVPANKTFQTKSGKTLENVDLVMLAFGNRPDTLWLKNSDFGSSILSSNGYVKVNSKLQVDGQDNLYVLGDAADLKETKMAFRIGSHSSTVLANLTSQIQGGKASTEYKKDSDAMVVTFGSKQGVGLLPLFGGMTIGSWASSKLKGATMFYAKSWESLNLTPPSEDKSVQSSNTPIIIGVSAIILIAGYTWKHYS